MSDLEPTERTPLQPDKDTDEKPPVTAVVANMVKNIVGAGVLSLPGGLALCSDSPRGLLVAVIWIAGLAALFGYFCALIARSCRVGKPRRAITVPWPCR